MSDLIEKEPEYAAKAEVLCLTNITSTVSALRALSPFPRGGRERALCITKLEEAAMWLRASVDARALDQQAAEDKAS